MTTGRINQVTDQRFEGVSRNVTTSTTNVVSSLHRVLCVVGHSGAIANGPTFPIRKCFFYTQVTYRMCVDTHDACLIEQPKAHVIILFVFGFFFLLFDLLFSRSVSRCTTSSSRGSYTATRRHRGQLLTPCSNEVFNFFSFEFADHFGEAGIIGINTDGSQDFLDIASTGALVATEHSKQVCGHVTHYLSLHGDTKRCARKGIFRSSPM